MIIRKLSSFINVTKKLYHLSMFAYGLMATRWLPPQTSILHSKSENKQLIGGEGKWFLSIRICLLTQLAFQKSHGHSNCQGG